MTKDQIIDRLRTELSDQFMHARRDNRSHFVCARCQERRPTEGDGKLSGVCDDCWASARGLFVSIPTDSLATDARPSMRVLADVREFHAAAMESNPRAMMQEREGPPALIRVVSREKLIREERDEHIDAQLERDLPETLDALVDQIYVLVGTGLIQFGGRRFEQAWDAVHAANMRKRHEDGTFHVLEDGKVTKPEGWVEPDIAAIVEDKCEKCGGWGNGPGDVVLCPECDGTGEA